MHTIAVMYGVGIGGVLWLGGSTRWCWCVRWVEVFSDGSDGLESERLCRFGAVKNDLLPDLEPVFDVSCSVCKDPLVDSLGSVANE